MNIDNKINKLNNNINNNKELLDAKYKERNDLLENCVLKNKDIELEDLDKYIENTELEIKKMEKELKNIDNLNVNSKSKIQLCSFYKLPKGCNKGNKCTYAHGEIELKQSIKLCISGLKCYKEYCRYYHPTGWNYRDNIKICEYYKNGYCINEDNCKFKHINETNNDKNIEIDKKEDENNEITSDNIKTNNYDYIKDVVNNHLHENIIYNIIKNNKNKEIINYNKSPNLSITINGINEDNEKIIYESEKQNKDEIFDLTNNFEKYIVKIKKNIDETFINDKYTSIIMKIQLNQIMSKIKLFEDNIKDIKKNI
jgi:hypothetical protein